MDMLRLRYGKRNRNETLPDYPGPWDEAHERTGQVAAAVAVVPEKGR